MWRKLQQQLLARNASLIGVRNDDPLDQARGAAASASSWQQRFEVQDADMRRELDRDIAFVNPVDPEIRQVDLRVDVDHATRLEVELWATERRENYLPHRRVAQDAIALHAGADQWITASLPWRPDAPSNACVIVRSNAGVVLYLQKQARTGTLTYVHKPERVPNQFHIDNTDAYPPAALEWDMKELPRTSVCFRAGPPMQAFAPAKAINGFARPYGGPNCWSSAPMAGEEWIQPWPTAIVLSKVTITFNDDVNEHLNNLHKWITPYRVTPEMVKDYRIEARVADQWQAIARETGNRRRHRVHGLASPLHADAVRIVIEATHGAPHAEVYQIRVY